jgi:hypothetical protein
MSQSPPPQSVPQAPPIIHGTEYPPELFAGLLAAYKKKAIGVYYERKNSGAGRSQSLGILPRRGYGVGESRNNTHYKHIFDEARKVAPTICPDINWTTLMLNHNYEALPHIDKNNDGYSCVVAFGDYTGGELVVDGKEYDIRHKPFKFCAAKTRHSVKPVLSGDRYSLVFFRPVMPKNFQAKYPNKPSYDEILALIPPRAEGASYASVKVPC